MGALFHIFVKPFIVWGNAWCYIGYDYELKWATAICASCYLNLTSQPLWHHAFINVLSLGSVTGSVLDLNHQNLPTAPGQIFIDDLEYSNINNASHFRRDSRGQWVRRRTGHLARGEKRKQSQLGNTVQTQLGHCTAGGTRDRDNTWIPRPPEGDTWSSGTSCLRTHHDRTKAVPSSSYTPRVGWWKRKKVLRFIWGWCVYFPYGSITSPWVFSGDREWAYILSLISSTVVISC